MMKPETKAIVYATMLGTLLKEFTGEESISPIEELKSTVGSFLRSRSHQKKRNGKLIPVRQRPIRKVYVEAVTIGDACWNKAIDHFKDKKLAIEIYSTIVAIWSSEAELMEKMVGISEKKMNAFMATCEQDHETVTELNAYEIAKFLTDEVQKYASE